MVNYYAQLKVSPTASEEEIKKAINRELRVWSNRTNAPQMERRQEAEKMVKQLEEAERILLNAAQRKEYDLQLKTAPTEERQVDEAVLRDTADLVQEGWRLLIQGNIPDALFVATKATEKDASNPEAWALLGQAKYRWGDLEDAIYEYKRAVNLRPNEASYYFDLGCVYESAERWNDALLQFQRASQIDPATTMYRASIGILFIKNEKYKEGIDILERCVNEDPNNETFKWYLAIAYTDSAYQNWTFVPEGHRYVESGWYATTKEHVEEALNLVNKAEALQVNDADLAQHIKSVKKDVQNMSQRSFRGNKLAAGAGIILGLIFLGQSLGTGLLYIASGILYIPACMVPKYILNRRFIAGKGQLASEKVLAEAFEEGVGSGIATIFLQGLFIPVYTSWNFIKNYLIESK